MVDNLTVSGKVTSDGGSTVGGFVGKNYGKITNCTFKGTVSGDASVGGVAGINEVSGQLINCNFQGTVTGEHYVGGIVGQNTGSLIRCEKRGDVNTTVVEVEADLSLLGTAESVPAGTEHRRCSRFFTIGDS